MVNKIYINFFSFHAATEETTAAPSEETTAVPPGKTTNNMEQEKKKIIKFKLSVVEFLAFALISEMVNKIYISCTLFHAATEESTAAPGEKTTAAPSGKTPNNMEQEKKKRLLK